MKTIPMQPLLLRKGKADAAIWRHCDGSHKGDEIASLRSQ